jgi:Leucine Rich repeat
LSVKVHQNLDLGYTTVTDAGAKELRQLNSLLSLSLWCTKVTDASLKELAGLKSLQKLDLGDTKVTYEGVEEFQAALPKCHIFR